MLYGREQMIHEANTYSEHLIHSHDDVSIKNWPPQKFMMSHETREFNK